jgi:hypothetical protein
MKILFENVSSCQQHAMFTVWIRKLITGTGTSGEFDFTRHPVSSLNRNCGISGIWLLDLSPVHP